MGKVYKIKDLSNCRGGCHHQHFPTSSMAINLGDVQSEGCQRQDLTHASKSSPGVPAGLRLSQRHSFAASREAL